MSRTPKTNGMKCMVKILFSQWPPMELIQTIQTVKEGGKEEEGREGVKERRERGERGRDGWRKGQSQRQRDRNIDERGQETENE